MKKILGALTLLASLVWIAFFINSVDRNQPHYLFFFIGTIDILLVVLTKFWQDTYEQTKAITILRILAFLVNVRVFFFLLKIIKSEVDLDDLDDVFLSITMFIAILVPFFYLYTTKSKIANTSL